MVEIYLSFYVLYAAHKNEACIYFNDVSKNTKSNNRLVPVGSDVQAKFVAHRESIYLVVVQFRWNLDQ
jgi:hypothetical protein